MAGKKATGKSVQPKKKSTASKTAVSRKKTTTLKKSGGQMKAASGITIRDEVMLWLGLALAILMFISNIGFGGIIGDAVSGFLFGIFGFLSYLLPLAFLFTVAFMISNKGNTVAWIKFGAILVLWLCLCALTELITNGNDMTRDFLDYFRDSSELKTGGGIIGGLLCRPLESGIGIAGAYAVLIILSIICVVLITEKSLFAGMRNSGNKVYETAKRDAERRREKAAIRKERRQMERTRKFEEEKRQLLEELDQIMLRSGLAEEKSDTEAAAQPEPEKEIQVPEMFQENAGVMGNGRREAVPEKSRQRRKLIREMPEEFISVKSIEEKKDEAEEETEEPELSYRIEGLYGADEEEYIEVPLSEAIDMYSGFTYQEEESVTESFQRDEKGSAENLQDYEEKFTGILTESEGEFMGISLEGGDEFTGISPKDEEEYTEISGQEESAEVLRTESKGAVLEKSAGKIEKKPRSSKEEQEEGVQAVAQEIEEQVQAPPPEYVFPPIDLLKKPGRGKMAGAGRELQETAAKLQKTLHDFGVEVSVTNVSCGPSVTRYELAPKQGVKVSRIVNLADDIKLNLAAADIRIEAPIPGKAAVGIEVPNKENSPVMLRELLESSDFQNHPSNLAFAAGKDIAGKVVVTDIAKMPHLLIAGATGSGKSVCINTIIMSILYKAKPEDVKLIMIDPKVVELSVYNGIPHLYIPVVTDPKKAAGALNWGVAEMTERYKKFADLNVRDLKGYNAKIESIQNIDEEGKPEKLPQIVIIVDELADLMMVAPGEVEDSICRLAQLARAAGIHLIIATQRPSVNVITGLIKANMPSRIAFAVSSGVDSRTIIDMHGAEKLLGKGDCLFYPQGYQKPARVQGAFVSDDEVGKVVEFLSQQGFSSAGYDNKVEEQITKVQQAAGGSDVDSHFAEAGKFIIEKEKASIGMLQRVFKIGFNRAARIMDQLCEAGVVGPEEGTKPRKVLMSMEEFEQYLEES